MLKGRLGLESARIPYKDRHGIIWLRRGHLTVRDGTLVFTREKDEEQEDGVYDIPFQMLTCIILQPGTMVSHDALRLLARHGTGLVAAGEDGVRLYASMPFGADESALARKQVIAWADPGWRIMVARRMYAWRMGEVFPHADLTVLRGMEGARVKESYNLLADRYGLEWKGRKYDRLHPTETSSMNLAINHASVAVIASACVAVAATSTLPQLGFIHEDSANAFALDIADLFREEITVCSAFSALSLIQKGKGGGNLERCVRQTTGTMLREKDVLPRMIDHIKELFTDYDSHSDA